MKTTTSKLTTTETRAKALCDKFNQYGEGAVTVEWKRSSMYGSNPSISSYAGKCCNVSGCGYCKESTALADVLRFLFPHGTTEHNTVWTTGGAGVSSVMHAMECCGWNLKKVAESKTSDSYTLTKINA